MRQCSMFSCGVLSCFALVVAHAPYSTVAQPNLWVDVAPTEDSESEDVEKRYTPELLEQLESAKAEALLLYTEYQGRAAIDLRIFSRSISGLTNETIGAMDGSLWSSAPHTCRKEYMDRLNDIEYSAQRLASYSAQNHHKFFLGHMIVFRMHLNKSEDYIKKCERVVKTCGIPCETTPKLIRWRRMAANEINRVRDDIQHSRKYYKDLLSHAAKRLKTLRRQANSQTTDAIEKLRQCVRAG